MDDKKESKQMPQPPDKDATEGPLRFDLAGIKKLLVLMDEHDLVELEMEQGDLAVRLKKRGAEVATLVAGSPTAQAAPPEAATSEPQERAEELVEIKSPMVGTFYPAPSPDADPFVKVGDSVSDDTVVCVIEAMKVFNEIRAEATGTIAKICVPNSAGVEFGQALFLVRPAAP